MPSTVLSVGYLVFMHRFITTREALLLWFHLYNLTILLLYKTSRVLSNKVEFLLGTSNLVSSSDCHMLRQHVTKVESVRP